MTALFFRLRLFPFFLAFIFLPVETYLNSDFGILLKKFSYVAVLFVAAHALSTVVSKTLRARKEKQLPFAQPVFYSLTILALFLIITCLGLLNVFLDKTSFYIVLLMLFTKITEVSLSFSKHFILFIITAIIFDSLASCISFELIRKTELFSPLLIGLAVACMNGALITSYKISQNKLSLETTENLNSKNKQTAKAKEDSHNQQNSSEKSTKRLLRSFQLCTFLAPLLIGLAINLRILSPYYYTIFVTFFASTYLFSKLNSALNKKQNLPKHFFGQTALICFAFDLLIILSEILYKKIPLTIGNFF